MDKMKKPKSKPVKSVKPVRVGANRQMQIAEKRAKMPSLVKQATLRFAKAAVCAALVGGIVFSVWVYGPAITDRISGAVKSGNRLPSSIKITGCSLPVQVSLMRAIDSMTRIDSSLFCRAGILSAVSAISEIESVNVNKIKGLSKDKTTLITVKERKPVAMIHNGGIFLVDKKGICFSPVPGRFYDLPLLTFGGVAPGDTVDLELFNKIKKTARGLGGAFFREISEIDMSRASEVNMTFRSSDTEYKVAVRDVESRIVHVKAIRERLKDDSAGAMRIDLRYRNLAFATAR
jgi:cell division septal protein FtsQ